jgi:hypothetical protein
MGQRVLRGVDTKERSKAFSEQFSESTFSEVIGNVVWYVIQNFRLPGMYPS